MKAKRAPHIKADRVDPLHIPTLVIGAEGDLDILTVQALDLVSDPDMAAAISKKRSGRNVQDLEGLISRTVR